MRRGLLVCLSLLVLSGCATMPAEEGAMTSTQGAASKGFLAALLGRPGGAEGGDGALQKPRRPAPLLRANLAGGAVAVAGPEGYCVDPQTLRSRANQGFAVLASCNILSAGADGPRVDPMLVTVTVLSKSQSATLPTAAVLAASAGAGLIAGRDADGWAIAHLDRGGENAIGDGDPRHWRGAFRQNGHLVGLALYAPRQNPLAGTQGGAMLAAVRDRIAAISPGATAPPRAATGGARQGVFGRLFNTKNLP